MLLPLAALVSGCQAGDRQTADPPAPVAASVREVETDMTDPRSPAGPRIATYRPERPPGSVASSATARLEGTLALVDDCLVIAGGSPVQPVFPEGSVRWEDGRLIFKGAAYPIGSRIVVGGGGIGNESDYAARPGVSVPACGAASLFIVVP
jgi:hypothetical protein